MEMGGLKKKQKKCRAGKGNQGAEKLNRCSKSGTGEGRGGGKGGYTKGNSTE